MGAYREGESASVCNTMLHLKVPSSINMYLEGTPYYKQIGSKENVRKYYSMVVKSLYPKNDSHVVSNDRHTSFKGPLKLPRGSLFIL